MKSNEDFRDETAGSVFSSLLSRQQQAYSDEALVELAESSYDAAEALLDERTKRFGPAVQANRVPAFATRDDEPIPYRPATRPPPPISGAEFVDKIRQMLPNAFEDVGLADAPSRTKTELYPPALADADELQSRSTTGRETQPAPPDAAGTTDDRSAAREVAPGYVGAYVGRGPLRQCEDGGCGCRPTTAQIPVALVGVKGADWALQPGEEKL